jgi:hypothetical protein
MSSACLSVARAVMDMVRPAALFLLLDPVVPVAWQPAARAATPAAMAVLPVVVAAVVAVHLLFPSTARRWLSPVAVAEAVALDPLAMAEDRLVMTAAGVEIPAQQVRPAVPVLPVVP